jgi:hypothetical protein
MSATAYSIYSLLPFIPGGRLLHPQSEDAPSRQVKEDEMGRACSTHEAKRSAYRIIVRKPERKRLLRRPRCNLEDNIKMDLREEGWGGMDWIHLALDRN